METKEMRATETNFANVDLDIMAIHDLSPLVCALAPDVFDLYTGKLETGFETHLELATGPESAESAISCFVALISQLPPAVRSLWDEASQRDFNIGIESGTEPHAFEFALSPHILKAVSELGARVVVTVYAVDLKE